MKYYIGNIIAATVGFGMIGSILIVKYFDHNMLTTLNMAALAVGGMLIAASMISAIYKACKLKKISLYVLNMQKQLLNINFTN